MIHHYEIIPGNRVVVDVCENFPSLVGKSAKICAEQKDPGFVVVRFADGLQGKFTLESVHPVVDPSGFSGRVCRRCRTAVRDTDTPGYSYHCPEHDDDLYEFETVFLYWGRELKPCPFCGKAELEFSHSDIIGGYQFVPPSIHCTTCDYRICGAEQPRANTFAAFAASDISLIDWWNTRAQNKQE